MAVAGLVLLIACVNVANLMLAHGERRRGREPSGGSRRVASRLIRQLLAESLVLSVLGAVAGLLMSVWAGGWLVAQLPAQSTERPMLICRSTGVSSGSREALPSPCPLPGRCSLSRRGLIQSRR